MQAFQETRRTIYVGNLDENVTEHVLKQAFLPFGDIVEAVIPLDQATSKPRGFAFVEYEDPEDAQHAIENMNNAEFYGKVLKVNLARPDAIRNSRSTAIWEREEFLKRDLQKRQKPEEEEEEDEPKDKMDTSK